jgi:hypothetical protein
MTRQDFRPSMRTESLDQPQAWRSLVACAGHDSLGLYGVHAAIEFSDGCRGTGRLDSVNALIERMREDV